MPQIVRLFHGSQIVRDVLEAGRFYHDFFGSWVYEAQHLVPEGCVNSANLLGGNFSMELLAPLDPAELVASVSGRAGPAATGLDGPTELTVAESERQQGLWWYLLVAGLILLAAETAIANQLSRKERFL